MTVPFNTIASAGLIRTNVHAIEADGSRAIQGRTARSHKILYIGRKLTAGSVAELVATRVFSGDEADAYFGVGSELAEMVRAGKTANSFTEMWAIGIDPLTGGTAGTVTVTITGPATADGTIHLYIAGHYIPVAVSNGDVQNDIATAVNAAIQAYGKYARLPFTSSVGTNVVTLTMKWKGVDVSDVRTNYNDGDFTPAGLTVAVAAGVAGAGNPDISEVITAIAAQHYDTFAHPFIDATNMGLWKTEMARRWEGMVKKWSSSFVGHVGNHGAATSLGNAHNSPYVTIVAGNTSPTPHYIWAAVGAAVDAKEPMPSRPRQTLALPGCLPAARDEVWTDDELNALLFDGVSTHRVSESRDVTIDRFITTYQTNAQAVADPTWLDICTPRTLAAIMYDLDSSVSIAYPRHLLSDDGGELPIGLPVVTPKVMKGHIHNRWKLWRDAGWVEPASEEDFLDTLIVERPDDSRTRLDAQLSPDIMNQFRGLSAQVSFVL